MNNRQRFTAAMHYQPRDRSPIADFGFWEETIPIWHEQGLPEDVFFTYAWSNTVDFFGMDFGIDSVGIRVESSLCPGFEEKILEEHGNRIITQQSDGVLVERDRFMSSIPKPIAHTLTDRDSWKKHFAPRLNPDPPERFPFDWDERVQEMITTCADCIVGVLEKVFASGVQFDACGMWEDMAYNAGPLLSPKHFKKYMVPHYRRITDLCRRHGVDVIWVDRDGKIDALLPLLLMMGGFDKHILARTKTDIEREILRLAPLAKEGGFIGFCDHRVPPDVPYENYLFYLEKVREIWGKGINLKPMGKL